MARRIRRNETLEPTHMVRGPATILTFLVMKSVSQTCFSWILCVVLRFLLSMTTMSVKLMLHFWWNLKVSVFWTVVQPPRLVELRAPCSPRVMNMILEFQRLIRLVVDHSTLEMVFHQRLLPWPDSQSEMVLLLTFRSPVHLFVDQPKLAPLLLGMDFLKEQRCVIDYGKELIQFPMQSDCWWPLFVSSRGLYSNAIVRSTLGAFITRTMTNYPHRERLSGVS